ncbi:MAG: histidine phosphatase family protein [Pseudomonadota bacterium]|nr:histidine phosphatase family protein [Pseudomonadota bacterium]
MESDQQPTRVIAIRHGETDWNVDGRIQGQLDVPLNAKGRWQVRRLAQALEGEALDAIYASDLSRALETAEAVAAGRALSVVVDPGLRERGFGRFEGQTHAEIQADWPEDALRWRRRDPTFGAPGGETLELFYARAIATATRLAARHPGQSIALVSHGGVMDCLYRAACRLALDAPRSWQLGNAAINRLLYTPQGYTLVGWSDAHHLDAQAPDLAADS